MTARPVNPAKPSGRSGAPPSAMVEKLNKLFDEWENGTPEQVALLTQLAIAAMFDNLPREVMGRALDPIGWPDHRAQILLEIDAAISAARAAVLGSAKGDA